MEKTERKLRTMIDVLTVALVIGILGAFMVGVAVADDTKTDEWHLDRFDVSAPLSEETHYNLTVRWPVVKSYPTQEECIADALVQASQIEDLMYGEERHGVVSKWNRENEQLEWHIALATEWHVTPVCVQTV